MICPICSSSIKDDLKFCEKCGKEIPRCPTCGNVLSKKKKFCGYDGTAIPESILSLFQEDATGMTAQSSKSTEEARETATDESGGSDLKEEKRHEAEAVTQSQSIERGNKTAEQAKQQNPVNRIRYCGKCGKPCDDGQAVCSKCRQLNSARKVEPTTNYKPKKKKSGIKYALITLLAVLCLLAAFVTAFYFINGEIPFISQQKGDLVAEGTDLPNRYDDSDDNDSEQDDEEGQTKTDDSDSVQENGEDSEVNDTDTTSGEARDEIAESNNGSEPTMPDVMSATVLFSSDVAQDIAGQRILGASINEAASTGWAEQWIRLYYYGGTDEQSQTAEQRTRGIPLEIWLQDYVTYDRARDAGWGDAWLTLAAGLTNEGTAVITQQTNTYDEFLDFVNNCDTQYFGRADLEGMDASMAILARNAPYAHAGRKFTNDTIRSFFEQFNWYHPLIEPDSFKETMLNDYEKSNKDLVVAYEKEMGYK